ncbi:MAG: DNA polymerase III subunit delta [Paramuribaculum sp.]|nr:DNA polymerase III subunit delta [Paramuribaculum sp.]
MAPSAPAITFASLKQSLKKKDYVPVYLLHGEEAYYIDELTKLFEAILPESERDFNLYTIYAQDSTPAAIEDTCMRFPMISERQVVIVKDAQNMKADQLNQLSDYASKPNPTTILAICSRGKTLESKKLTTAVKAGGGVIFESKKLKDRNVDTAIEAITKELGLNIEPKGIAMLRDYIGNDVSRLYNQLEKMAMILPKGATITPESIELNIGISKDFNNFELIDAIAEKKNDKIFRIIEYFRSNPKKNPTVMTASALFNYFSNLMIYHYTRDKSPASAMAALGFKWHGQLKNYEIGARNYNAFKVIEIITALREFDTRSKGIGSRQSEWDLLRDLMFRITTAEGKIVI